MIQEQWNLLLGNGFSIWYAKLFHGPEALLWKDDAIINVMIQYINETQDKIKSEKEDADGKKLEDYNMIMRERGNLISSYIKKNSTEEPCEEEKRKLTKLLKGGKSFESIFQLFTNYEDLSNKLYKNHIRKLSDLDGHIDKHKKYIRYIALLSILTTHPCIDKRDPIEKTHVKHFLRRMNNIFTTNYDLILYYITFEDKSDENTNRYESPCFADGFGKPNLADAGYSYESNYLEFNNFCNKKPSQIPYYYLHGAFHIGTVDMEYLRKEDPPHATIASTGKRLVKLKKLIPSHDIFWVRIASYLLEPIIANDLTTDFTFSCVVDGNPERKKDAISRNSYLSACRERFQNIRDNLVIFGHSLSEEDGHIVEWIGRNKNLKKIIIYYHGSDENPKMKKAKKKIEDYQKEKNGDYQSGIKIELRDSNRDSKGINWKEEETKVFSTD